LVELVLKYRKKFLNKRIRLKYKIILENKRGKNIIIIIWKNLKNKSFFFLSFVLRGKKKIGKLFRKKIIEKIEKIV
jgi:hypothetical protein